MMLIAPASILLNPATDKKSKAPTNNPGSSMVKPSEEPDEQPEVIFGYNLILIVGIVGITTIVILRKQKKSNIK